MNDMDVHVFGAGSLGCALGGFLARRNEVTLIGRAPIMEPIRRNGLRILGDAQFKVRPRAVTSIEGLQPPRLILVATKAYDTPEAVRSCAMIADDHTLVLTLQNGLGNLEALRAEFGGRAFGGATTMGAAMISPGTVRISGSGRTVIGADMDRQGAREIAHALEECGLRAVTTANTLGEIWAKAIVNACINPTAAVLRVPNGQLIVDRTVSRFIEAVCDECVRIALAEKVRLPARDMVARVRSVCRETSGNKSSMLQDVLRGKRTEIREITGAICSCGERHGIQAPLNSALLAMVESLEADIGSAKG